MWRVKSSGFCEDDSGNSVQFGKWYFKASYELRGETHGRREDKALEAGWVGQGFVRVGQEGEEGADIMTTKLQKMI